MDFLENNDIEVVDMEKGIVKVEIRDIHLNPYGIPHGGLIYTLADHAMGMSLASKGKFVTINANINYLSTMRGTELITKVIPNRIGSHISTMSCEIYDDCENLIAIANASYFKIKE